MINIIDNSPKNFLNLQGQHFNMAAIVGRSWKYPEIENKKGKQYSVCLFDTNNFYSLTKEDKKLNHGKTYFELMQDKNFRDNKILENITTPPDEDGNKRTIKSIFTSLLLTPEIEDKLDVSNIETKFLKLLEESDDLTNIEIIKKEENINKIKDYLALQFIRSPLWYRFLLNGYFEWKNRIYKEKESKKVYREGYPALFKEFSLLDTPRIKELTKYAEWWYQEVYKTEREKLNNFDFIIYKDNDINLHLGDITTFYFNFANYGINTKEIEKMVDYKENKNFLDNILYSPITPHSFIAAFPRNEDINEISKKFEKLVIPLIKKGFHNQIIFIYSKYIICPPVYKEAMKNDLINFFSINTPEYIYNCREEEISYIQNIEKILKHVQTYESLYKKIEIPQ